MLKLLQMVRNWIHSKAVALGTTKRNVRGLPVTVVNTRPDVKTEEVFSRLDQALGLLERYVPHLARHLKRDFKGILVQRYECRGAYFPQQRICLVELTFTVNREFTTAQVAATILHEAMHARLERLKLPADVRNRSREERFCRRAEIEFGSLVPGGEPILDRAWATIESTDSEVAIFVEKNLAQKRIAEADLRALNAPNG